MGLFSSFTRLLNGDVHYHQIGSANFLWNDLSSKIESTKTNPILLPAIQLIADYYASAKFYEMDGDKIVEKSTILSLLSAPNPLQTQDDFLKQLIWYKYACGFNYTYPVVNSFEKDKLKAVKYLYNLKPDKIEFKKDFWSGLLFSEADKNHFFNQKIYYDRKNKDENKRREIPLGDILPFYDTANGLDDNMMTAPSRLDSIKMPISNIDRAFEAKNIVIQSNGKEMITNETVGNIAKMPIKEGERKNIIDNLSIGYGLGWKKRRTIVTNSALKYQSLHIVLKDLGLDESVIKDAQTIVNALNIPPELFSLSGTSATFENQEKAIIHFLQSKIQGELNDMCNTFNERYDTKLIAKLDHLPIMSNLNKVKIATLRSFAFALEKLVSSEILTAEQAREEYYKYVDQI